MDTQTQTPCAACESRSYASFRAVTIGEDVYRVCDACIEAANGPGKFEGCSDIPLALVLYALDLDGGADHSLSDESGYYAAQFGRYVLTNDDRGFVDVTEYADADAATKAMNGMEDDGLGADEHDAWIADDRNGYAVSFDGKYVGTFERESRARAAVSIAMRKSGYYPNVWRVNDHGNVSRTDVW